MKQTAVEWLLNEFQEAHKDFGGLDLQWLNKFEQAKETEKEHIMDAYDAGLFDGSMFDIKDRIYKQYYEETFNK